MSPNSKKMKKKILLVEDSPTIQRLLHFMLSKDFEIHVTGNGYEAFLWLEDRAHTPDLIIMDWVMPYMDGKSFLKSIKVSGFYSDIPVIVLSAFDNMYDELKELPYSVEKCLPKPFDPVVLKQTIMDVINVKNQGILK